MMDALKFADTIGRKKMAEALEVGPTAISNAVVRGSFPPAWNETCKALAAEKQIEFPVHLFGQRGSYSIKGGRASAQVQAQASEKVTRGAA